MHHLSSLITTVLQLQISKIGAKRLACSFHTIMHDSHPLPAVVAVRDLSQIRCAREIQRYVLAE